MRTSKVYQKHFLCLKTLQTGKNKIFTSKPTNNPVAEIIPSSDKPVYLVGTKDKKPTIEGIDAIVIVLETEPSSLLKFSNPIFSFWFCLNEKF